MAAEMPKEIGELQAAVAGLLYPSESDEPFDVVWWQAREGKSAREAVAAHGAGRKIETVPIDAYFSQLDESDDARRFRMLRQTLESRLSDLSVFRVGAGEVRVDVYLIGRNRNEDWVGVHTVSVET